MFNLEDLLRTMLNGVRDGVTVGRAKNQRLKDQHIESSLEHLSLHGGSAPWHVFQYTPLDYLPKKHNCYTPQIQFGSIDS